MGKKGNPHVYFDVSIGSQNAGRIMIEVSLASRNLFQVGHVHDVSKFWLFQVDPQNYITG